jgi:hypothetical protein
LSFVNYNRCLIVAEAGRFASTSETAQMMAWLLAMASKSE